MLSLTSKFGVVGFRVGQGEFMSILRIREMMKKMLGGVFLTVTVAEIPPEGLKEWVPRSLGKKIELAYFPRS